MGDALIRFNVLLLCVLTVSCRLNSKSETYAAATRSVCSMSKSKQNFRFIKPTVKPRPHRLPNASKVKFDFKSENIIPSFTNGCKEGICNLALSKNAGLHLKLPLDLGAQANVVFREQKTLKGCKRSVHYEKAARPVCIGEVLSVDMSFALGTIKEEGAPVAVDAYCQGGVKCNFGEALNVKGGFEASAQVSIDNGRPKLKGDMKCLGTAKCDLPFLKATAYVDKDGLTIDPNIGINNTNEFIDTKYLKLGAEKDNVVKLKWKDAFLKCKELLCKNKI